MNSRSDNIKVKICGITRKEDLETAEQCGADLIGFIHVKRSPRFLELSDIKSLKSQLNDKNRAVLVLEPTTVKEAKNKILESEIKTVQLHSLSPLEIKELKHEINEKPEKNSKSQKIESKDIQNDKSHNLRVICAIGLSENISSDKKKEIMDFAVECDAILLDYQLKGKSGGTGKQIPLDLAREGVDIAREANDNIEVYLAGGMDIQRIKTDGMMIKNVFDMADFNSSLEDEPGKKNKTKIKDLLDQIKKLNMNKALPVLKN